MSDHWFERLEDRRLMSVTLVRGVLVIRGSDNSDQITFSLVDNNPFPTAPRQSILTVNIDGHTWSFDASQVHRLNINGAGGDDKIAIQPKPKTSYPDTGCSAPPISIIGPLIGIPSLIKGGAGDDTIVGGWGNDTIYGGAGNDRINGGSGHNLILGDGGNDELVGGDDPDTLIGGPGNDILAGLRGDDILGGRAGQDKIYGGKDNDRLIGGTGNDFMWGEDGTDQANGGRGDDASDTAEIIRQTEKAAEPIFWVCLD